MIWRIIFTIIILTFITWFVIYKHTPKPQELIFDYSCLNSERPCPIKLNESRRVGLKKSVEDAVKDSYRFGKLSEIYVSIMRFDVSIRNNSNGYIVVPATNTSLKVPGQIQCLDGIFAYQDSKEIEGNFSLNDSADNLTEEVTSFISQCPGFSLTPTVDELKKIPAIPPNSEVRYDIGLIFTPVFKADFLSRVLVFIFNSIVLAGLLPLAREIYSFFRKGIKYFNKSS